jgi:hypothetical protein
MAGLVVAALVSGALAPPCAAHELEYQVKAEFIERFPRFIEWPSSAFAGPDAAFVLCVIGATPLERYLDRIARTRRIKERRVELRRLKPGTDPDGCHLVFVAPSERQRVRPLVAHVAGRAILTVADADGFAQLGIDINLILDDDGHVRFEICANELRRSGLNVSAQLLRLARPVAEVSP